MCVCVFVFKRVLRVVFTRASPLVLLFSNVNRQVVGRKKGVRCVLAFELIVYLTAIVEGGGKGWVVFLLDSIVCFVHCELLS